MKQLVDYLAIHPSSSPHPSLCNPCPSPSLSPPLPPRTAGAVQPTGRFPSQARAVQPAGGLSIQGGGGAWPFSCVAPWRLPFPSPLSLHPSAQHEQFNRQGDFPAKVAEGVWPFSCVRASHTNGIALPYGIYSHGARVLCAGGGEEGDGGEGNGGGAVVMAQLQVGGGRQEGKGEDKGEGKGEGRGEGVGKGKGEGEEGERDKGRGKDSMGGGTARRAVLLTANVCFMDGPGAQLNVAFSEASLSLRQDDTVLPTGSRNNDHTARRYQATDGSTNPSDQSLHGTWASPHWKTPLPTHLPASLPPLPPKPLYGVPHYIYTDLYATPLPEHPNKRLETQNMERRATGDNMGAVFSSSGGKEVQSQCQRELFRGNCGAGGNKF
ncbi:unnamed protein product [Closterium sp. NIES-54]